MLPPKAGGESMLEIKKFLEQAGLNCLGEKVTFSDLCTGQFPVIAHMITTTRERNLLPHWVVVEGADAREVKLYEGFGFPVVLPTNIFTKEWDGNILRVTKPEKLSRPSFVARSREGDSRLQFETLFIDAGDISQSTDSHLFVFPFLNTGREDLHLLKVKTDCKCAVVEGDKEKIIPPGERGEIVIQYTFGTSRGRFRKHAMVKSNDPYFPIVMLTLAGNGQQEVKFFPTGLRFGDVPQGANAEVACFLTYTGNSIFEIKGVKLPSPELQISTESVSPEIVRTLEPGAGNILLSECQNRFMISATINTSELELGQKNYSIRVLTNLRDTPELTIPVSLHVVPTISATPSCLFLGELSEGDIIEESITIRSLNGSSLRVNRVDLNDTGLKCLYSPDNSGIIKFHFTGQIMSKSQIDGKKVTIVLAASDSDKPFTIDLPISALFKKLG